VVPSGVEPARKCMIRVEPLRKQRNPAEIRGGRIELRAASGRPRLESQLLCVLMAEI
jgi:hypothetical protein